MVWRSTGNKWAALYMPTVTHFAAALVEDGTSSIRVSGENVIVTGRPSMYLRGSRINDERTGERKGAGGFRKVSIYGSPSSSPSSLLCQMEADGVATAGPSSPPDVPDLSPFGSPDIIDSHLEGGPPKPSDDLLLSQSVTLSNDLRDKIIKQVEYYFSDENLPTDNFLMKYVRKDKEGFVPIAVIATFRRMKKLTEDISLIVAALGASSLLVVNSDGKKVKRLHPLPPEAKDPKLRTVLVENLPEDHSTENIRRIFGQAGKIKGIYVHVPHTVKEHKKHTAAEKLLLGKLHALVEYETVEAAEKAVAMLNNEQDWRYGMRVKLCKRMGKHKPKKAWRESDPEKSSNVQVADPVGDVESHYSSEQHDDSADEEEGENFSREKNGHRGRNRGRARRQKYRGPNGQGHGTVRTNHVAETSKPPPGPRMPDGTRGFTIGRGRPAFTQN